MSQPFSFTVDVGSRCKSRRIAIAARVFANAANGIVSPRTVRRRMPKQLGISVKARGKSRITNGKTLLPTASSCSVWARLTKNTLHNLVAHCGGADMVSETQRLAARRVSVLEAELVYLEDKFAATREQGGEPDPRCRVRKTRIPIGDQFTARSP